MAGVRCVREETRDRDLDADVLVEAAAGTLALPDLVLPALLTLLALALLLAAEPEWFKNRMEGGIRRNDPAMFSELGCSRLQEPTFKDRIA